MNISTFASLCTSNKDNPDTINIFLRSQANDDSEETATSIDRGVTITSLVEEAISDGAFDENLLRLRNCLSAAIKTIDAAILE